MDDKNIFGLEMGPVGEGELISNARASNILDNLTNARGE
jgi:hypothetical protein